MNGTGNPKGNGANFVPRYEVVDKDGNKHGPFHNVIEATAYAQAKWPDQEQDEERSGKGWDLQVLGAE